MPGRDREYTNEVGERIKEAFTKDNVVQSTNVAARCVFEILRSSNRQMDLMRLLRLGGAEDNFELRDVYRALDELMTTLRKIEAEGGIRLSPDIRHAPADDVMADALRHFSICIKNTQFIAREIACSLATEACSFTIRTGLRVMVLSSVSV